MTEETAAVQNKGMLAVAIVLGLAAVVLYNWQVRAILAESRGEQVKIVRFERDMRMGERIDVTKDLRMQEVSKRLAAGLGPDVVQVAGLAELQMYNNSALNRNVSNGQFLTNSMIITSKKTLPSEVLSEGDFVAIPIPVRLALGDILRPGDRVNLLARVPMKDGKINVDRVIDRVRVLAVGGKGLQEPVGGGRGEDEGSTTYRQITIEVSSDDRHADGQPEGPSGLPERRRGATSRWRALADRLTGTRPGSLAHHFWRGQR